MAESISFSAVNATEEITFAATIDSEEIVFRYTDAARGPAGDGGGGGSVTSYVDDIETLPDYPDSFPTTPADINNVGHAKILGRHGAGTGTAQEIGIDGGLELQGGNLRRAAVTGPVTIAAGGSVSAIADDALTIAMVSGLQDILNATASAEEVANKQDILVSGTNIKTVNGESLIGSGNVALPSLADAAIITGTSTTQGIVSPAQLKAAAEEHGGGGSSTTIITLASDTAARVSTTTFANETGLTLPTLTAEKAYKIEWAIIYSSGAGGIKTQFQVPSIKTANAFAIGSTYSASSPSNAGVTSGTPATIAGGTRAGINSKNTIVGFAYVFVDATGGVTQFQWAQNSSDAADTKILAGSVITITPLF